MSIPSPILSETPPIAASEACLTGFVERLGLALLGAQNGLAHLAVLLLEFEQAPGPDLALRLRHVLRRSDTLSQLGPRRFAVLLEGLASDPHADARRLTEKLREALPAATRVGLAVHRSGDSDSPQALLARAAVGLSEPG